MKRATNSETRVDRDATPDGVPMTIAKPRRASEPFPSANGAMSRIPDATEDEQLTFRNPSRMRHGGAPTWLRRHRLAIGLLVSAGVLAGLAIVLGSSLDGSKPHEIHLEAVKALATLATGLLLGGVLKLTTDNHADASKLRVEASKRYDALIADMHDNHDRLETARLLISAHRSAEAYGDRMRDVVAAHVVLLKIARTRGMGVLETNLADAEHLEWMLAYLVALQREYGKRYKRVSDLQKYDEEVTRQTFGADAKRRLGRDGDAYDSARVTDSSAGVLDGDAAGDAYGPVASDRAWTVLHSSMWFPVLDDLCGSHEQYNKRFLTSCKALTIKLRDAKAAGLPLPPPDGPRPDDSTLRANVHEKADQIERRCEELAELRAADAARRTSGQAPKAPAR